MKQKAQIARAPESADDALTATLIAWGRCYGVRLRDEEPARASHPIARAIDEQGRKSRRKIALERAQARAQGRRVLMARGLNGCGVRMVPAAFVDPVPCRDDSGRHRGLASDPIDTPQVQAVQQSWLALQRHSPHLAAVLVAQYQRPDLVSRAAKAASCGISESQFKDALRLAGMFIRGALTSRRTVVDIAAQCA